MNNVLQRLQRVANGEGGRFPSLRQVHELLVERGVEHDFSSSVNVVERPSGNGYVSHRHNGRRGYRLILRNPNYLEMNSAHSYYSANSWNYARQLVELLNN